MNLSSFSVKIFIILVFFAFYKSILQPFQKKIQHVNKDTQLQKFLKVINDCKSFDERSVTLANSYVKRFFYYYYGTNSPEYKLKKHRNNISKYLHRVSFRIHNDIHTYETYVNAVQNILKIIDNYIYKFYNDKGLIYFVTNYKYKE